MCYFVDNLVYTCGMAQQLIHEVLKTMREERGWSQTEMAERLGLSPSVISRRESGLYRWTTFDIKKAAEALGTTVDDINRQLAAAARLTESTGIPVINRAPAGELIDYEEYGVHSGQGYQYLDRSPATKAPDLFAVIVVGRSMCPKLEDGDTVILKPVHADDPDTAVKPGQVVFVRLGTDEVGDMGCMLAQWWPVKGSDDVRLHKVNPEYQGRVVPKASITRLAVAVEKRSRL